MVYENVSFYYYELLTSPRCWHPFVEEYDGISWEEKGQLKLKYFFSDASRGYHGGQTVNGE